MLVDLLIVLVCFNSLKLRLGVASCYFVVVTCWLFGGACCMILVYGS